MDFCVEEIPLCMDAKVLNKQCRQWKSFEVFFMRFLKSDHRFLELETGQEGQVLAELQQATDKAANSEERVNIFGSD